MKTTALDRLKAIAVDESIKWTEKADWRKSNREWLDKSARIAIKILRALRAQQKSQKDLAAIIRVTPQYINKIVKGQENLSLETICKIETALGIELIAIPGFQTEIVLQELPDIRPTFRFNKPELKLIGSRKYPYESTISYVNDEEEHYKKTG
jgi:transcriptional regulator with XRE-family HTH domain